MDNLWIWLVDVGGIPTPLKNMTSSVGMIILNGNITFMFRTTNQMQFHKYDFLAPAMQAYIYIERLESCLSSLLSATRHVGPQFPNGHKGDCRVNWENVLNHVLVKRWYMVYGHLTRDSLQKSRSLTDDLPISVSTCDWTEILCLLVKQLHVLGH